jgi:hypothetical protein
MLRQEGDLVRDSADDIGAGQDPDTMRDGIRQAAAEPVAQLGCPSADHRIGGVAAVKHGAERRRPGATADTECLKLGLAQSAAVLDRVGPDPHQPRIWQVAVHRDPRPGGVGGIDRLAQRSEVVRRRRRLRHRPALGPFGEVADDLHPGRPGGHLGLDRRNEFARRDRGVHAGEVPVRRGKKPAGGGDNRASGCRGAREAESDLAAAAGVADHRDPGGRVPREPRGAVRAVGEVGAVLVNGNRGVRVRVDEPGQRVPAGQLLRLARPGNHPVARKAVKERP